MLGMYQRSDSLYYLPHPLARFSSDLTFEPCICYYPPPPPKHVCVLTPECVHMRICTSDYLGLDYSDVPNTACTVLPPRFDLQVPLSLECLSLSSPSKSYTTCEDPTYLLPVKLSFILSVIINRMLLSFLSTFNVCLCYRS